MRRPLIMLLALLFLQSGPVCAAGTDGADAAVPILVYHRFGKVVADAMTVKTTVLAAHLEYLHTHGYTVIPLRDLVEYLMGEAPPPPARSVVITADDGHKSVYTDMFPLITRYHVPVTLFIYPSAISNAKYAMTWRQLGEMRASGLVDIQSHTLWHPNFRHEKKRLSPDAYEKFVRTQMARSKEVLEQRLGGRVDMLAWPFGIFDQELMKMATQAGYVAGFTLVRRNAGRAENLMALPRFLMTEQMQGRAFERLVDSSSGQGRQTSAAGGLP